jgi:hypothetical protein
MNTVPTIQWILQDQGVLLVVNDENPGVAERYWLNHEGMKQFVACPSHMLDRLREEQQVVEVEFLASSVLKEATFTPYPSSALGVLSLTFRHGGIRHYHQVSLRVMAGLAAATSPGRYYNMHIKRRYRSSSDQDAFEPHQVLEWIPSPLLYA